MEICKTIGCPNIADWIVEARRNNEEAYEIYSFKLCATCTKKVENFILGRQTGI